jgi:hypothetical protein
VTAQRKILVASEAGVAVRCVRDVVNAVGATLGSDALILTETDLCAEFFDLRTGIAGELFQKFHNYKLCVALIVAEPLNHGERFNELAREHRSHNCVRVCRSKQEALEWLCA